MPIANSQGDDNLFVSSMTINQYMTSNYHQISYIK